MDRRKFLSQASAAAAGLWLEGAAGAVSKQPATEPRDVLVVGAGIAGLTAAYRLAQKGLRVTVLEASNRPGGRMTTDATDGYLIDRGAQFLSSTYPVLMPLIRECGLESALAPVSPWSATVRDGRPRRVRAGDAASLLDSGLLGRADWMQYGVRYYGDQAEFSALPINDYSGWAVYDDENARAWSERHFGVEVTRYLIEPMMQGFYFQSLEGMSRALPMAVHSLLYQNPVGYTLRGGIGTLPQRLARDLDVRYDAEVTELSLGTGKVRCRTREQLFEADRMVLATTASAAKQLYRQADVLETALMSNGYSATIVLALATRKSWGDTPALAQVYGLLIPQTERDIVAAVGIESFKNRDRAPQGEVLNVMLSGAAAARLWPQTDAAIQQRALRELAPWFPGLEASLEFSRIYRWREAEPLSPVGRSRRLRDYRSRAKPTRRVYLAGDYMGMPYTEGAAESADWVARQILSG